MPDDDPPARKSAPTPFELVTSRIHEQEPPAPDPPAPAGFVWVTADEFARRIGFRLRGDRQQIYEDFLFMITVPPEFERG
jgi:hypothetical protein